MVNYYVKLVRAGVLDINSVPSKYREKVREIIENE